MERAYLQCVSGSMFGSFALRPALGRLFLKSDDLTPGALNRRCFRMTIGRIALDRSEGDRAHIPFAQ
jgi:hypothetical protein